MIGSKRPIGFAVFLNIRNPIHMISFFIGPLPVNGLYIIVHEIFFRARFDHFEIEGDGWAHENRGFDFLKSLARCEIWFIPVLGFLFLVT